MIRHRRTVAAAMVAAGLADVRGCGLRAGPNRRRAFEKAVTSLGIELAPDVDLPAVGQQVCDMFATRRGHQRQPGAGGARRGDHAAEQRHEPRTGRRPDAGVGGGLLPAAGAVRRPLKLRRPHRSASVGSMACSRFLPGIPGPRRRARAGPQGRHRPPPRRAQRLHPRTRPAVRAAGDRRTSTRWRCITGARQAAAAAGGRRRHPPRGRRRPRVAGLIARVQIPAAAAGPGPGTARGDRGLHARSSRRWRGPRPTPARCPTTWPRRSARCGCSRRAPSGWSASPPTRCSCATRSTRRASRRSSSRAANTSRRQTFSPRTATPTRTARPTAGCVESLHAQVWQAVAESRGIDVGRARRAGRPGAAAARRRGDRRAGRPHRLPRRGLRADRRTGWRARHFAGDRRRRRRRTRRRGCTCPATRAPTGPACRRRRSRAARPSRRSPS